MSVRLMRDLFLCSLSAILMSPSSRASSLCKSKLNAYLSTQNFLSLDEAIGFRGMLVPIHRFDPLETITASTVHGLLEWYIKIFVAPSLEAARVHNDSIKNHSRRGLYIISTQMYPERFDGYQESEQIFRSKALHGIFWFDDDAIKQVPPSLVETHFHFSAHDFVYIPDDPSSSFLAQHGFFFPKDRGVIFHDELAESNSILKYARQLSEAGFTFSFNKHFDEAMNQLRVQRRKDQQASENLFGLKGDEDSSVMKNLIKLHAMGRAFTTEVVDPNGHLVAGNVFFLGQDYVSSDTVFYDTEYTLPPSIKLNKQAAVPINMVKVSNWVLSSRIKESGVPFLDIQVVSNLNKDTRGRWIPVDDFLQLRDSTNPDQIQNIDVISDWKP